MKASIVVKKVVLSCYRKPFAGRESWLFCCLNSFRGRRSQWLFRYLKSFEGRETMWLYRNHMKLK